MCFVEVFDWPSLRVAFIGAVKKNGKCDLGFTFGWVELGPHSVLQQTLAVISCITNFQCSSQTEECWSDPLLTLRNN